MRHLLFAAAAALAACGPTTTHGPGDDPGATFADVNGVMWFYTTSNDTRFTDLAASLDDWKARGIRVIGIYSPYFGEKEEWLGAAPRDFYATPPQCGTVDDFRALVTAAHARGMKVIAFMGFHSIDERSELFATAEAQYRDGDRTSPEVSAFHWTSDASAATPTPAPFGPSQWKPSQTAGASYWALWDNAGLDVNLPGARRVIDDAIAFWLDTGLDGYMLDSGVVAPEFIARWVEPPLTRTDDFWLTFESTQAWNAADYDGFGLTAWFAFEDNDYANTYSRVVMPEQEEGEQAIDADGLEEELAAVGWARERGKLTHAWSVLERPYPDERMRVQEAALLAGAGVMYGAPMYDEHYVGWPAATRTAWEAVLVAVNDHPALRPSAPRERLGATASGATGPVYAMLASAADGDAAALLVYNFGDTPTNVTVSLAGADLGPTTPVDLLTGEDATPIGGDTYTVQLDAYGFAMLGI
jgi:hypothetical protein